MHIRSLLPAVAACTLVAALLNGCSANNVAAKLLGIPSPEEQQVLSQEFVTRMPDAKILVLPMYFRDRDKWVPAEELAGRLEPFALGVVWAKEPPNVKRGRVPPTSYRYWGRRSAQYRKWILSASPDVDFVLAPEIYTVRVPRSQLFVFDRKGRLMQISSVHWGHNPPRDMADAADRIIERFVAGMATREGE